MEQKMYLMTKNPLNATFLNISQQKNIVNILRPLDGHFILVAKSDHRTGIFPICYNLD